MFSSSRSSNIQVPLARVVHHNLTPSRQDAEPPRTLPTARQGASLRARRFWCARNLLFYPSSPRPSPPGEGESPSAFLKNRARDSPPSHPKTRNRDRINPLPGERIQVRAGVQLTFVPAESGAKVTALQTLSRWPGVLEFREASGLRRVYRRFPRSAGL